MNMPRLSNLRVGRRLGIAFGAVGALVLVSAGAGLSAVGEQRDLAEQLSAVDSILADSGTARFQIADVTGWQGLVLADVAAYGPGVALAAVLSVAGCAGARTTTAGPGGASSAARTATMAQPGSSDGTGTLLPLVVGRTPHNRAYLRTKAVEMGHLLAVPDDDVPDVVDQPPHPHDTRRTTA